MNKMRLCVVILSVVLVDYACQGSVYKEYLSENDQKRAASKTTILSADEYCQINHGNTSYLCRDQTEYQTDYDSICDALYCFDTIIWKLCINSLPPNNTVLTSCGNGKVCQDNHCTSDPHATVTSDACPLGDTTKGAVMLGMGCEEIVAKNPSLCNDAAVGNTWCCGSCSKLNKPDPATFAGPAISADHDCKALLGDPSYFCQTDSHYNGDYSDMCSNMLCYSYGLLKCVPYPASDGVPCGNGKWCVNGKCTVSAAASVDPVADCLYGNQFETFCRANIVYPNVATYCSQYEQGCCSSCYDYKNTSAPAGCEYGDKQPVICQQHVTDETIHGYCHTNEADCCQTCGELRSSANSAACPFGDVDSQTCDALMVDSIGPGNCYSRSHLQDCCVTCATYFNASKPSGCEYGDHWKDYCAQNVVPPNVSTTCDRYETKCCETCGKYEALGFQGCEYGNRDPVACDALLKTELGTANCYNIAARSLCCATCEQLKTPATPGCLYGDTKPAECAQYFNDSLGYGNCYDLRAQIECCRSCAEAKNDTNKGCEYGDHLQEYCSTNIVDQASAFLCFQYESQCCATCPQYELSDKADCKYGDKNPIHCKFQIADESVAAALCPTLGVECCATCSKFGHPGPAGGIPVDRLSAILG